MSNLDPLTDAKLVRGLIDLIYPVGSDIFNESVAFNPNQLYPNTTWEQIRGVMPIGVDEHDTDFNSAGKTGGSKEMQKHKHDATTDKAGDHRHPFTYCSGGAGIYFGIPLTSGATSTTNDPYIHLGGTHDHAVTVSEMGNGNAGNMPPYRATYWWHRTK